jgi:CHAT domain-containing protein
MPAEVACHPIRRTCFAVLILFCGLPVGCNREPGSQQQSFNSIAGQLDRFEYIQAIEPAKRAWLQSEPGSEFHWKFQLQYAHALLLNNAPKEAAGLLKDAPPQKYSSLLPRFHYLRAYLLFWTSGDPSAGERMARTAIAGAQALHDPDTKIDALLLLYAFVQDPTRAKEAAQQALDCARAHGLKIKEADALLDLGSNAMDQEHYGDALGYFKQVAPLAEKTQAHFIQVLSLSDQGECYFRLGDFDRSFKILNEAKPLLRDSDGDYLKFRPNYVLGYLYLLRRQLPESVESFRESLRHAKPATNNQVTAAIALAETLLEQGATDEAEKVNTDALSFFARVKDPDKELKCSIDLNRGAISAAHGNYQDAASTYQMIISAPANCPLSFVRWNAYANLASIQEKLGQFAAAKRSFEETLSLIEKGRSSQKNVEYQITFLSTLITFYQRYVDFLIKQQDEQTALAVADSSHSLLTQGRASSREMPDFADRLRRLARLSNSVVLFYWLAEKNSYLWAITPGGIHLYKLIDKASIEKDVFSYNRSIQLRLENTLQTADPAGKRLNQELLGQVAGITPTGSRVTIIPDGALHNLNFETLLVDGPTPHYWIDDVTVTVAPSLGLLLAENSTSAPAGNRALLIGDARYAGTGYPELAQSAEEIASVGKQFADSAQLLTQGAAQVQAFQNSHPERFATIHISAHVDADSISPLDSAIILSPSESGNRLYARDIANAKLTANLMTISGCRSAGAKTLSGEGLVGFAWASFLAGAHNAVTSLWEVDDRSTADLMGKFYEGVASGSSYAVALREAKRSLLQSTRYQKPYYWAPFQLYSRSIAKP